MEGVIATVEHDDLCTCQHQDKDLADIIKYLEIGILPSDESHAPSIALTAFQYVLEDNIPYRVESDCSLRVIPPETKREKLFMDAHSGMLGAHLSDMKVHSELRHHY